MRKRGKPLEESKRSVRKGRKQNDQYQERREAEGVVSGKYSMEAEGVVSGKERSRSSSIKKGEK